VNNMHLLECNSSFQPYYINESALCVASFDGYVPRYYAISRNIATMEAVSSSSKEEGVFTSLQAHTGTDTNITAVYAGSSNGYLVKVCILCWSRNISKTTFASNLHLRKTKGKNNCN